MAINSKEFFDKLPEDRKARIRERADELMREEMDPEKRAALEKAGFVFTNAEDFLELTEEERQAVEHKLRVQEAAARQAEIHRDSLKKLAD